MSLKFMNDDNWTIQLVFPANNISDLQHLQ